MKAKIIALDERGKNISSEDFSNRLARLRDDGAACTAFMIGGADGLDETLRKKADIVIGFGAATSRRCWRPPTRHVRRPAQGWLVHDDPHHPVACSAPRWCDDDLPAGWGETAA